MVSELYLFSCQFYCDIIEYSTVYVLNIQHNGLTDSMDVSLSELWEMVMDGEAWRAVIHGVPKSRTRLSN